MRLLKILWISFWLPNFAIAVEADITVCFTPGEPCEQQIIAAIANAKKKIYVQAYSFTANYIADALLMAQRRGVEIRIILDRSWLKKPNKNRAIMSLYKNNIPIWIDYSPSIAHNKIVIIDQAHVITGSYNFTIAAARHNAENVVFITSPQINAQYLENWQQRLNRSKALPAYDKPAEFSQFRQTIMSQTK